MCAAFVCYIHCQVLPIRCIFAGSCITLWKTSSSIWTARHSSLTRRVRTEPEPRSGFPQRRANARASTSVQAQPIIYIGIILHCADAKHWTYMDMVHMMIHSTSQLEMGKKANWSGMPKSARNASLRDINVKGQSIWSTPKFKKKVIDKHTSDSILEPNFY